MEFQRQGTKEEHSDNKSASKDLRDKKFLEDSRNDNEEKLKKSLGAVESKDDAFHQHEVSMEDEEKHTQRDSASLTEASTSSGTTSEGQEAVTAMIMSPQPEECASNDQEKTKVVANSSQCPAPRCDLPFRRARQSRNSSIARKTTSPGMYKSPPLSSSSSSSSFSGIQPTPQRNLRRRNFEDHENCAASSSKVPPCLLFPSPPSALLALSSSPLFGAVHDNGVAVLRDVPPDMAEPHRISDGDVDDTSAGSCRFNDRRDTRVQLKLRPQKRRPRVRASESTLGNNRFNLPSTRKNGEASSATGGGGGLLGRGLAILPRPQHWYKCVSYGRNTPGSQQNGSGGAAEIESNGSPWTSSSSDSNTGLPRPSLGGRETTRTPLSSQVAASYSCHMAPDSTDKKQPAIPILQDKTNSTEMCGGETKDIAIPFLLCPPDGVSALDSKPDPIDTATDSLGGLSLTETIQSPPLFSPPANGSSAAMGEATQPPAPPPPPRHASLSFKLTEDKVYDDDEDEMFILQPPGSNMDQDAGTLGPLPPPPQLAIQPSSRQGFLQRSTSNLSESDYRTPPVVRQRVSRIAAFQNASLTTNSTLEQRGIYGDQDGAYHVYEGPHQELELHDEGTENGDDGAANRNDLLFIPCLATGSVAPSSAASVGVDGSALGHSSDGGGGGVMTPSAALALVGRVGSRLFAPTPPSSSAHAEKRPSFSSTTSRRKSMEACENNSRGVEAVGKSTTSLSLLRGAKTTFTVAATSTSSGGGRCSGGAASSSRSRRSSLCSSCGSSTNGSCASAAAGAMDLASPVVAVVASSNGTTSRLLRTPLH